MSEQRVDDAADAATTAAADEGEGQGLASEAAHEPVAAGESGDMPVVADERLDADEATEGETEGERAVRAAQQNQEES